MSNSVFPSLPGLTWGTTKTPEWKTIVQESVSGKELAASLMTYPRWTYTLSYEFLRSGSQAELQTLVGFFNARRGKFDDFLYADPDDNTVTAQQFGVGDGVATSFALVRSYGGFTEPVQNLNSSPQIYKTDWRGMQMQYATPRTNLFNYSEQFNQAFWQKARCTITPDAVVSPDGSATADKLIEDATANNNHYLTLLGGMSLLGGAYAFSVYARAAERTSLNMWVDGGTGIAYFDLINGIASVTVGASVIAGSITPCGGGWYRCTIQMSLAAGVYYPVIGIGNPSVYTGDGVSGVYVWGAQLETGSTATGYIPTTAAPVTVTDCSVSSLGVVTFAAAPAVSVALTWTGTYYWRVRFLQDSSEFTNFMQQLYSAKKISFKTVKL